MSNEVEMKERLFENHPSTIGDPDYGSLTDDENTKGGETQTKCDVRSRATPVLIVCIVSAASLVINTGCGTLMAEVADIQDGFYNNRTRVSDHPHIGISVAVTKVFYDTGLIVGNLVSGRLAFRYGHVLPFWFGLVSALVAILSSVFASRHWWSLAILNFVFGFSRAVVLNAGSTMVAIAFVARESGRVLALNLVYSCIFAGTAFGYGGRLYEIKSLDGAVPFWILFAVAVVIMVIRAFIKIDNNRASTPADEIVKEILQSSVVKSMLTDAQTLVLIGLKCLFVTSANMNVVFAPLLISRFSKADNWQLATVLLVSAAIFFLCTNFLFGIIVAVTRRYRWIYLTVYCLAIACAFVWYRFIGNIWQSFGPHFVSTVAFALLNSFYFSWLSDVADRKFDGNYETIYALDAAVSRIVGNVCLLIIGALQPVLGYPYIFVGVGVLHLVYSFASLAVRDI
ncbi:chromaffin granule amine transporter-like [Tubulanus polymorphus]|uniref:chromaffin granule amine transporter-like n=1 Tax=Tubulanus polymorphus TaxID=672921 RepID=UPI003DA6A72D